MRLSNGVRGLCALVISAGLCLATPVFADNAVLDNAQVVQMVKLGLDAATIRTKIEASRSNFDTSPQALAALQSQGVSAELIQAMIKAGAPRASASSADAHGRGTFALRDGSGKEIQINPVRVTAEVSQRKRWIPIYGNFANAETFMTIQGAKASVQAGTQPEFVTSFDPLKVRLMHMADNKEGGRYVVFDGNKSDRELRVESEDIGGGLYRLRPAEALKAGEQYAFLAAPELPSGLGFWAWLLQPGMAAYAYDFSAN